MVLTAFGTIGGIIGGFVDGRYLVLFTPFFIAGIHRSGALKGISRPFPAVIYSVASVVIFVLLFWGGIEVNHVRPESLTPEGIVNEVKKALPDSIISTTEVISPPPPHATVVTPSSTPYCAIAGKEPRLRGGDDPYCEFDNAHFIARGRDLISKLTTLVAVYQRDTADMQHTAGPHPERMGQNARFRQSFEDCCSSELVPYRKELIRRLPAGANTNSYMHYIYEQSNPQTWRDIDTHAWDVQEIARDLEDLTDQLQNYNAR